jgi:hypothetical protein
VQHLLSLLAILQEELRLAHVAATRAKDVLFLTAHRALEGSNVAPPVTMDKLIAVGAQYRYRKPWLAPAPFSLPSSDAVLVQHVHPPCAAEEFFKASWGPDRSQPISLDPRLNGVDGEQSD